MKIENIIRRVLREQQEEEKLLKIPGLKFFNNDWNILQMFLESQGNPRYSIGGDLDLSYSDIKTLGNLVRVEGDLDLNFCRNLQSIESLEYVGGFLDLKYTKIESLGELKYVGDFLDLKSTKIESLGELKYVGDFLDLESCQNLESLENLEYVGGYLNLRLCKNFQSLGNLEYVGKVLNLMGCKNLVSLGNLEYVGGHLYLLYTPLEEKYTEEQIRDMVQVVGVIDI